ncbi:type I methionyl aminopeptidase [Pseudodesulfovibrio sediminis]|uniref:Methionine aminopeptidase n=1 Tax=Pseudodesulfovibrio sediminis TaxID=2810563 RepID=A0ABN6EZ13_9BACT|nr:type I methionyl aminopeptidase [Pseudodesulfovibrio sediminis]BCS90266.1 methionine aminopeptidase [Pseudodesulfovibrio sediminis]
MKKFRGVFLKNDKEIGLMREANRIVSRILDELGENVKPGVSTMHFEEICRARCKEYDVRPAFLGYQGFPFALCCSVNEEIVHGFPSEERIITEGDIVSFDMGVVYNGFFGDSARTFGVGQVAEETQKLMDVTRESLYKGIEQAIPGNNLYDISAAIQSYVEGFGFGIVRRFVGHGIGSHLHEKPEIPNFVPKGMTGIPLKAGMVLAIEPMVTVGTHEVDVLEDNWTAVTKDRKLSAHFEHTIAVTSGGPRILSLSD